MRVVIDTNVVVSATLSPKGASAQILESWKLGDFVLLVSEPILEEYQRALNYQSVRNRHKKSEEFIVQVVEDFRRNAVLVPATVELTEIKDDPADSKFLECAIAGSAEYIISGDSHLQAVQQYHGIRILAPAVFLAVLKAEI